MTRVFWKTHLLKNVFKLININHTTRETDWVKFEMIFRVEQRINCSGIRTNDLRKRAGALPTELSSPILAVFLLTLSISLHVRGARQKPYNRFCRVARDHTQITIQPGKQQPGDHLKGMRHFVSDININHK